MRQSSGLCVIDYGALFSRFIDLLAPLVQSDQVEISYYINVTYNERNNSE